MEVFVLMGEIIYEGDLLLGVYASEQEAADAHGVYTRGGIDRYYVTRHTRGGDQRGIDRYYVTRQVVGAPADSDLDVVIIEL